MTLNFAIDYMKVLEADEDTAIVELDLLHIGKNRNGYDITKEAIESAIPTIYNKPIIYRLNNEFIPDMATDVLQHGTLEDRTMRIAGIIPESAPMEFVERNGKEYLRTKGIIYKIYQPALMNILKNRDGNLKVSIEILVSDKDESEDGYWIVNEFKFEGVALLGEDVKEGIEGSQLNVIRFSADELNEQYLKFADKKIPEEVKAVVIEALKERELKGKGGSNAALNMAKFLASNEKIDYTRFNYIKDYFDRTESSNSLSFSLFGGEASKNWLAEFTERKEKTMGVMSVDEKYSKIRKAVADLNKDEWRYWTSSIYENPDQVIVVDEKENKFYLMPYEIMEDVVVIKIEEKKEMARCFVPVEEVKEDTLLFKLKEVLSINEDGQLIKNTHRLSLVDSDEARKTETLLNSLEKEDNEMEEKEEEVKNACEEEEVVVVNEEAEETEEAEEVETVEEEEDKKEDEKQEEGEDFEARCKFLEEENAQLKASLEVYARKEEVANMNALISEFSYCFKEDEEKELKEGLEKMTFAEVEKLVNEKVRAFAKENKPKEEDKFSTGLAVEKFSYKPAEVKENRTLADVKNDYVK